jgi:pyrimidine operon attenuation protein/uracil phosphoribosyltransferase
MSADRVEILSAQELSRTLNRLASQVLESVADSRQLLLLGIPTRGVALAQVLAAKLEVLCGHPVDQGSLDPTFHRDDLDRVGTRLAAPTELPTAVDGREVVLVDDVIFTGRTVRAAHNRAADSPPPSIPRRACPRRCVRPRSAQTVPESLPRTRFRLDTPPTTGLPCKSENRQPWCA